MKKILLKSRLVFLEIGSKRNEGRIIIEISRKLINFALRKCRDFSTQLIFTISSSPSHIS